MKRREHLVLASTGCSGGRPAPLLGTSALGLWYASAKTRRLGLPKNGQVYIAFGTNSISL